MMPFVRGGLDEAEFPKENMSSLTYNVKTFSEEPGNAILANIFLVLWQLAHRIHHIRGGHVAGPDTCVR